MGDMADMVNDDDGGRLAHTWMPGSPWRGSRTLGSEEENQRAETAMLRQHLVDLRAAWLACGSVVYGCGTAAEREAADRITTILGRG